MGKTDVMARAYLSDRSRFADAFNYLLYDGRRVIEPGALSEVDTAGVVSEPRAGGRARPTGKARDAIKRWRAMRGGGAAYAILALEEQGYVSREMPVRCMLYDALSYDGQVAGIARDNREGGRRGVSGGHFLSKMQPGDTILPLVTLVLYLGADEWDAPESLHGLMGDAGEDILRYVPDYKLNLVVPSRMGDPEFDKFSTELGLVLKYVKYSKDDEGLGRMVEEDGRYRELGPESAALINEVTNSRLELTEREGKVDMCRAIDEMRRKSEERGIAKGIEQGIAKGDHGRLLESARNLIANTGWDAVEALRMIGVPEADRPAIARELGAL